MRCRPPARDPSVCHSGKAFARSCRSAELGRKAGDRPQIREDPALQLSIRKIGGKEAETAGAAHRHSDNPMTDFDRKTYGHDRLQFTGAPDISGEARRASATAFASPWPARALLLGKSRKPYFETATGKGSVAAKGALGRRSPTIGRDGLEPASVRCCCPDGFQVVELLRI